MLGFVVRRLRGRWPLAVAVLLTVLITATTLTALTAFTRGIGEEGLRRALTGPERSRTTAVITSGQPANLLGATDALAMASPGEFALNAGPWQWREAREGGPAGLLGVNDVLGSFVSGRTAVTRTGRTTSRS